MTNVPFPENYFPHDDPQLEPLFAWRAHANLLWRNWLNWVYQTTPYDLSEVPQLREEKRLGTDRSIRHRARFCRVSTRSRHSRTMDTVSFAADFTKIGEY